MIPPRTELVASLFAAWCLIKFDPRGLSYFNCSVEGFWPSFFAAVVALPLFVALSIMHAHDIEAGSSSSFGVHLIRYAVGWAAFPIIMAVLARVLDRTGHYASYIIAVNWMAVPQWVLVLFASFAGTALGGAASGLIPVLLLLLLLYYDVFITRIALDLGVGKALLVVIIGVLLGLVLDALMLSGY